MDENINVWIQMSLLYGLCDQILPFKVFQAELKNLAVEMKVNNYKLPNSVNNP